MKNLNEQPQDLMHAVAVLEQNGASVFISPYNGQYAIVTGIGKRDGFTEYDIFEMARNLKAKEMSVYSGRE